MLPRTLLSKKFVGEEYLCRKDFLGISSKSQQQTCAAQIRLERMGKETPQRRQMCAKKWRGNLGARTIFRCISRVYVSSMAAHRPFEHGALTPTSPDCPTAVTSRGRKIKDTCHVRRRKPATPGSVVECAHRYVIVAMVVDTGRLTVALARCNGMRRGSKRFFLDGRAICR